MITSHHILQIYSLIILRFYATKFDLLTALENKLKHKYVPYRNVELTVSQLCILVTPHWNTSLSESRNVALFSSSSG